MVVLNYQEVVSWGQVRNWPVQELDSAGSTDRELFFAQYVRDKLFAQELLYVVDVGFWKGLKTNKCKHIILICMLLSSLDPEGDGVEVVGLSYRNAIRHLRFHIYASIVYKNSSTLSTVFLGPSLGFTVEDFSFRSSSGELTGAINIRFVNRDRNRINRIHQIARLALIMQGMIEKDYWRKVWLVFTGYTLGVTNRVILYGLPITIGSAHYLSSKELLLHPFSFAMKVVSPGLAASFVALCYVAEKDQLAEKQYSGLLYMFIMRFLPFLPIVWILLVFSYSFIYASVSLKSVPLRVAVFMAIITAWYKFLTLEIAYQQVLRSIKKLKKGTLDLSKAHQDES